MIQETWLPNGCLAMDGRSDSDIPAFSGTPHYYYYYYYYYWFQNYLTSIFCAVRTLREAFVAFFHDVMSATSPHFGTPVVQFFFSNDLCAKIHFPKFLLFADDLKIFRIC
jgi:hypothetical protein